MEDKAPIIVLIMIYHSGYSMYYTSPDMRGHDERQTGVLFTQRPCSVATIQRCHRLALLFFFFQNLPPPVCYFCNVSPFHVCSFQTEWYIEITSQALLHRTGFVKGAKNRQAYLIAVT